MASRFRSGHFPIASALDCRLLTILTERYCYCADRRKSQQSRAALRRSLRDCRSHFASLAFLKPVICQCQCSRRWNWACALNNSSCTLFCYLKLYSIPVTPNQQVHGGTGGADELRLLSDSDTFFNLRAHGGSLSFHDTKVALSLHFWS